MPAIPTVVVHHPKTNEPITINQADYLANQKKYKLVDFSKKDEKPSAPPPATESSDASAAAATPAAEAGAGATEEGETAKGKKKSKIFG